MRSGRSHQWQTQTEGVRTTKIRTLATVAAIALAVGSINTAAHAKTAPAIDTQFTQADNGVAKAGCYYRYVWSYYGGYYRYRYFWYCY